MTWCDENPCGDMVKCGGKLSIFQFSTMKLVTCRDQSSSIQDLRPSVTGPGWVVGSGGTLQTSATRWSVWCFFSLKRSPVQSLKHLKPCVCHDFYVYESVARGHDELLGSSHPETLKTLGILAELLQDTKESQSQNFTCLTSKEVLNVLLYFVFFFVFKSSIVFK